MLPIRESVTLTTDASGNCTAYSTVRDGRILGVYFSVGTLATTADVIMTCEATAEAIVTITDLAASATYYPRVQVHDETGTGATLDGTRKMREPVTVCQDRVKFVVAQGGNAKTGTATLIIG